ncbi:hypothetical protein [Polyangium sp. 15x6]|uniref:hypothetical protein n=1 Tax=Polyangium sp. 15x6 TaxID=3042687 RepID=UPI00249CE4C6|nr:hypothetical protein [Polyangium sp. 15x6]MDI3291700.1 hypothetical protein [Polyangium sp. 15x6]
MSLNELISKINETLNDTAAISIQRHSVGGVERVVITRKHGRSTRYMRITPTLDTNAPWQFAVLGGSYGNDDPNDDFDGRRGGDTNYVVWLVKQWLIERVAWEELHPFEALGSRKA